MSSVAKMSAACGARFDRFCDLVRVGGGVTDRGGVYQGTYAAARREGAVVAVAAHYWNGVLVVQAPDHLEAVVRLAVQTSHRQVSGVSGPLDQVEAAVEALGLHARAAGRDPAERHYALDLDRLTIPGPLASGAVICRRPESAELGLLTEWRAAYEAESLYAVAGAEQTQWHPSSWARRTSSL